MRYFPTLHNFKTSYYSYPAVKMLLLQLKILKFLPLQLCSAFFLGIPHVVLSQPIFGYEHEE